MSQLTDEGLRIVGEIAGRHGVSVEAVEQMLRAVAAGHGTQAQFNIPELGGMGQWSMGGMTMVGDMFNHGLKARVDSLCAELSGIVADHRLFAAPAQSQSQSSGGMAGAGLGVSLFVQPADVWPSELGVPASVGVQNDMRYAYFPDKQRLAIAVGGKVTVYETGDHRISGFGQAQGGGQSLSFSSQFGLVSVESLRVVGDAPALTPDQARPPVAPPVPTAESQTPDQMTDDQIFSRIERLAGLFDKGILTEAEYQAKKAELLARL